MADRASQDRLSRRRARERAVTAGEAVSASESSGSTAGVLRSEFQAADTALDARLDTLETKMRVRGRRTASQVGIATATPTFIDFNAADDFDFTAWHDHASGTLSVRESFTVPSGMAGFYMITAMVAWAAPGANASLTIEITVNGTAVPEAPTFDVVAGSARQTFVATGRELVVSDVVKVRATQTSGGNLDVTGASVTIAKVGA